MKYAEGVGYNQIAQFQAGVWNIINVRDGATYTANLGQSGDVPVAGKYLTGACTQVGVWRRGTQEFIVADPFSSCGTRSVSMIWGSNNDFETTQYTDDIRTRLNSVNLKVWSMRVLRTPACRISFCQFQDP